jgi:two-component system CheB/CheR fusion protein
MRAGASNFLEKPVGRADILACVDQALGQSRDTHQTDSLRVEAAARMASLTPRQREVLRRVLAGEPSKNIAADLDISQRTVENHRAEIMHKMKVRSIPELVKLAIGSEVR